MSKLQIGKCLQQDHRHESRRVEFVRQCLLQRLPIHAGASEKNLRDQNIASEYSNIHYSSLRQSRIDIFL